MSIANDIRTKVFGKDVREAIAEGIEAVESLRVDYNSQVMNAGNSNAEIVDARGGKTNLKARLNESDVTLLNKANYEYVDTKVQGVSLAYKESYNTLASLQSAYPTGDSNNHCVLADGFIYTYKNSWISTGIVANGSGITNKSISLSHLKDQCFNATVINSISALPNYDTSTRILNFNSVSNYESILIFGNKKYIIPAGTTVLNTQASSADKLIFDTSNNTFVFVAWVEDLSDTQILVAVIRDYNGHASISSNFDTTINGITNINIANNSITAEKISGLYPMWNPINMLKGGGKPVIIDSTLKTLTFPADMFDVIMYVGENLFANAVPKAGLVIDLSVMVGTSAWALLYRVAGESSNFLLVPYLSVSSYKATHAIFATCRVSGGKYIFNMPCPYVLDGLLYGNTYTASDIDAKIQGINGIDNYVETECIGVTEILLGRQSEKSCSFAFLTDMHYSGLTITNITHAMQSLSKISKSAKIEFVCFGGDNVANVATKSEQLATMSSLKLLANKYLPIPYIPVKGNHDDNSIVCNTNGSAGYEVLDSEYYLRLFKENENKYNIVFDDNNRDGLYCYMDLPTSKVRAIFLNSVDIPHIINGNGTLKYDGQHVYGYSNEQLNWVANKALNFSDKTDKSEWGVVVFQHILCVPVSGFYESVTNNGQVMFDIFKAFKSGISYTSTPTTGDFAQSVNIDFTSQGVGNLIAMISGHGHKDYDGFVDNILHITSIQVATNEYGNNVSKDGNTYAKVPGTADETGYDIFTIDKVNKIIYATRYGVGVDRQWVY